MVRLLVIFFILLNQALAHEGRFHLFLKNFHGREVHVYLPPGYERLNHLPVLVMHDGQNLFDPHRAYLGRTWNAEETLTELIERGLLKPIVVVGVDNLPSRTRDYTFDRDPAVGDGGDADRYLDLLDKELLPLLQKNLKITKDRRDTGILGSSLGGLVSLYAGSRIGSAFGVVGAMSPSIWWNKQSIVARLASSEILPERLYLDSGTVGGERPQDVYLLAEKLRGRFSRQSLSVFVRPGHDHSEPSWADRFDDALLHLFPSRR